MNWFQVIKENSLVSENITHTKVNEQDSEQDDDKCKKALIHFVETMDAYLDALGSDYFEWVFDVDRCIKMIESFPERRCCKILEKLRGAKNKTNPEAGGFLHYGFLRDTFAMMTQSKDYFEEREKIKHKERWHKSNHPFYDLMFFSIYSIGKKLPDYVIGKFRIKSELKDVLDKVETNGENDHVFEELQRTWGRVYENIMRLIP